MDRMDWMDQMMHMGDFPTNRKYSRDSGFSVEQILTSSAGCNAPAAACLTHGRWGLSLIPFGYTNTAAKSIMKVAGEYLNPQFSSQLYSKALFFCCHSMDPGNSPLAQRVE